jgi:hypothetical protein
LYSFFMREHYLFACLEEVDAYEIIIKNNHCSIYYNDIFYDHFHY